MHSKCQALNNCFQPSGLIPVMANSLSPASKDFKHIIGSPWFKSHSSWPGMVTL